MVSVEDPTNRYIGVLRDVNSLKTDVLLFQKIGSRLIQDLKEEITFSPPQTETFQKQVENLADDANPALILLHSKR